MALRINKDNFEEKVLKAELPVIVEFYSDSCVPCKKLSPILGDIEDDYEDKALIYKVNGGYDMELAQKYEVMATPTLVFFKNGNVENRIRGFVERSEIEKALADLLD